MRARVAFAVLALAATAAAAQPQPVDAAIRAVRKQIEAGRAEDALAALQAADLSAASKRDRARISFYTARALEELGDEGKAVAAYRRAIDTEPTYGAAMNNLAQLLFRRGDSAETVALLKRAIALDDPHRLLYLDNYAAAAERTGDLAGARGAYAQLAAAQPDNVAAQVNAIRTLDDPKRMAELLAKLAKLGEIRAAQSLAFDLLGKPYDERAKRAFLGIVAGTLAAQHIDPGKFDSTPAAARLAALHDDPHVRDGAAEIAQLYRGKIDPPQLRWWRAETADEQFAALIRDVGASRDAANDKQQAERTFKLALDYAHGADPDAFVALADLYFSQQRIPELDALTREYEPTLFAAKGAAIAARDYAAEYRFHVALGTIYAYLQRWGSEDEPASAIYQLTQARRAAADYNAGVKWGPKIPSDPKTLELLAGAYAKTQQADRAAALRIDSAEAFLGEGRKTAALQLLKPLANATPPSARTRYEAVLAKSKLAVTTEYVVGFPDFVDVGLSSLQPIAGKLAPDLGKQIIIAIGNYVTAESDEARDRAERALLLLGVTGLNPTTMSRTTGELLIPIDGKPTRYRYVVRGAEN
jgi:Tfp pilus assembly protein PilF